MKNMQTQEVLIMKTAVWQTKVRGEEPEHFETQTRLSVVYVVFFDVSEWLQFSLSALSSKERRIFLMYYEIFYGPMRKLRWLQTVSST